MAVSLADAEASKAAVSAADEDAIWRPFTFSTAEDAVNFANLTPAQKAGEFTLAAGSDGQWVGAYFF
ncbi:hypothetical protein ACWGB8_03565 [Kitasatospora sp. NPDC054939]